jgi:CRP-like cAMP-binding protein
LSIQGENEKKWQRQKLHSGRKSGCIKKATGRLKMHADPTPKEEGHPAALAEMLAKFSLTPAEASLVFGLQPDVHFFRSGEEMIVEGERCLRLLVIMEGFAIRYRKIRRRRHVLNIVLPGDVAGSSSCHFENALYSEKALTDLRALSIPVVRVMNLLHSRPQVATKLFWGFAYESAIYFEHITNIGRRNARERIGHFLLELLTRLQAVSLADQQSFSLPLTQGLIADVLGLSIPYVNLVLRKLHEDGLVSINYQTVVIDDVAALSTLVGFERDYLKPLSIIDLLSESTDDPPRDHPGTRPN